MADRRNRLRQIALLAGSLWLAFGLRLARLGADSLWYDETVSAVLANKSLPALVAHTAGDIHPPGYYLLLHGWVRLAGSSEFTLGFFSLFWGVLLVALAYRLGAKLFGPAAGTLAALLVALSPYNLWYSQEVRMYTLGAVLGVGLLLVVRQMLHGRPGRPAWGLPVAYALCGALGLWTLTYFAFLLIALNLMAGAWWLAARIGGRAGWGWLERWLLAQGGVLLLYAPWLPVALRQAADPPVPPWRELGSLGQVAIETWSALSLGQSIAPGRAWPALLLAAALLVLGLVAALPRSRGRWLLAGHSFLPIGLIYLASFLTPLWHVRYAFIYSTPFYVLLAGGLAWLWTRWRPAVALSLALWLAYAGLATTGYHSDPRYAGDDHRAAVRFLAERWRPGDAILVNAGYVYTALVTYWDGEPLARRGRLVGEPWSRQEAGPVVLQAGTVGGSPSLGWGDPAADFYAMSPAETEQALGRLFAEFDRVWVYRLYDTVTDPSGLIRGWLAEHGTAFEERSFSGEGQLRVQGYLTGREPDPGGGQPLNRALADGTLRLLEFSPQRGTVAVGASLDLNLVWQVGAPLQEEATLFAGLFDEARRRWAQVDEHPLGSLYPPVDWPAGAQVRTPLRLPIPPGTPPGRYRLEIGWYRFSGGQTAWLPWEEGERLALGQLEVVAPADWRTLSTPAVAQPMAVEMGPGVSFLGFTASAFEGYPGDELAVDLYWRAQADAPEPGVVVLRLSDDSGTVWLEDAAAPAGGRAPFSGLAAGQVLRDPRTVALPGALSPGAYNLSVGRKRPDGTWLPVRRGLLTLGQTYPVASIRVLGREVDRTPPAPQRQLAAEFGGAARLVGYDLEQPGTHLDLTLYWQALAPTASRYKLFVHLVGSGGPADLLAQADLYPRMPTTAWVAGEFLSDTVSIGLPPGLLPEEATLLVGLYDEATGVRLPVLDAAGLPLGDSFPLGPLAKGD